MTCVKWFEFLTNSFYRIQLQYLNMPGGGSITYLWLGHHGVLAVAQWGKVKALLLLLVPLLEELLHASKEGFPHIMIIINIDLPRSPLVVQVPGLGWVGHVTRVQKQGEDTWLVKTRGCLVSRKEALHLLQLTEVHWHVCTVDTISFIHLQNRANLSSIPALC